MDLCAVTHRKEDAARKWCPFAMARKNGCIASLSAGGEDPPGPESCRDDEPGVESRCLTNGCMAWIDETDYFHGVALGRCGLVTLSRI